MEGYGRVVAAWGVGAMKVGKAKGCDEAGGGKMNQGWAKGWPKVSLINCNSRGNSQIIYKWVMPMT